jgi:hypothetical protein
MEARKCKMNKTQLSLPFSRPLKWAALLLLAGAITLFLPGCMAQPPAADDATQTLLPTPEQPASVTPAGVDAYPALVEAYPALASPSPSALAVDYPPAVAGSSATPSPASIIQPAVEFAAGDIFFPVIGGEGVPPDTPTPTPTSLPTEVAEVAALPAATPTPAPMPTPVIPIDFAALRAGLDAQGRDLAHNKIGFHVTFLEDREDLDDYMAQLDSNGVPFFLKSVDNAEPVYKAQELMRASGVEHILLFRTTAYDVADYDLNPEAAAELDWERELALWPPELDPSLVWFETLNEPDKNRAEWLARFALHTAQLALRDGYRWAAFGWASGEPEPGDWESPAMLELLRLMGDHPDQLAIALHEYSYLADDIGHDYPYKVGRFLDLFAIADKHGIPRPTVLISEWGWTYNNIPPTPEAMADIDWAARLYSAYPEVKGAAIWNLGNVDTEFLSLNDQVRGLIEPLTAYSLTHHFSAPRPPEQTSLDPAQFPPP